MEQAATSAARMATSLRHDHSGSPVSRNPKVLLDQYLLCMRVRRGERRELERDRGGEQA
jgi:hypothetical protein